MQSTEYLKAGKVVYAVQRQNGTLSFLAGWMSGIALSDPATMTAANLAEYTRLAKIYFDEKGTDAFTRKNFETLVTNMEILNEAYHLVATSGIKNVDVIVDLCNQSDDLLVAIIDSVGYKGVPTASIQKMRI